MLGILILLPLLGSADPVPTTISFISPAPRSVTTLLPSNSISFEIQVQAATLDPELTCTGGIQIKRNNEVQSTPQLSVDQVTPGIFTVTYSYSPPIFAGDVTIWNAIYVGDSNCQGSGTTEEGFVTVILESATAQSTTIEFYYPIPAFPSPMPLLQVKLSQMQDDCTGRVIYLENNAEIPGQDTVTRYFLTLQDVGTRVYYWESSLSIGTHEIYAVYTGNYVCKGSITTEPYIVTVEPDGPTIPTSMPGMVSMSPGYPNPVATISTQLQAATQDSQICTGHVIFTDWATLLPGQPSEGVLLTVDAGTQMYKASWNLPSPISTGSHRFGAMYSGDAHCISSTTMHFAIDQYPQACTVPSVTSPQTLGTCTSDNLVSCYLGCEDGYVPSGSMMITCDLNGDWNPSMGSCVPVEYRISLSITPQDIDCVVSYGQPFTLVASVQTGLIAMPIPATGSVIFQEVGQNQALGTIDLDGNGQASFNFNSVLTLGKHQFIVKFKTQQSDPLALQVVHATTQVSISSDLPSAELTELLTLTITVTPQFTGVPTGDILLFNGQNYFGNGAIKLVNGIAKYQSSDLATGTYTLTAQYVGDVNFDGSKSLSFTQKVVAPVPRFEEYALRYAGQGTLYSAMVLTDITGTNQRAVQTGAQGTSFSFMPSPRADTRIPITIISDATSGVTLTIYWGKINPHFNLYIYAFGWPVGTYTFTNTPIEVKSGNGKGVVSSSGVTLTVSDSTFSGILLIKGVYTGTTKTIKWQGTSSGTLNYALATTGGSHL